MNLKLHFPTYFEEYFDYDNEFISLNLQFKNINNNVNNKY